eukprot:Selendium_serpulae@DN6314_c3_g1_i2.p1
MCKWSDEPSSSAKKTKKVNEKNLSHGRRRGLTSPLWIQYQHWTFLPLTSCFNVFFWHLYLHPRDYIVRKFDPVTFALVAARYICHFVFAMRAFTFLGSVGLFILTIFAAGVYLFGTFSMNHTYLPVVDTETKLDWVDAQMITTANVAPHPLVDWWMGYLNCQIEHHLFPQMPQFRQPGLTPRIKEWCESQNIPYLTYGFFEAIGMVISNLKRVGNETSLLKNPQPKIIHETPNPSKSPSPPTITKLKEDEFWAAEGIRRVNCAKPAPKEDLAEGIRRVNCAKTAVTEDLMAGHEINAAIGG